MKAKKEDPDSKQKRLVGVKGSRRRGLSRDLNRGKHSTIRCGSEAAKSTLGLLLFSPEQLTQIRKSKSIGERSVPKA